MTRRVFKFLDNFVTIKEPIVYDSSLSVETNKMSYLDFYKMLIDLEEGQVEVPTNVDNFVEKFNILDDKLEIKKAIMHLKQMSMSDSEVYLTFEFGDKNYYFMEKVFDEELDYVRRPVDKGSVYVMVASVGFTSPRGDTKPKPNSLNVESFQRRKIETVGGKPTVKLEDVPYLKDKMQAYLNVNINNHRSKVSRFKKLLADGSLEQAVSFIDENDLANTEFFERMQQSMSDKKPFDWSDLEYVEH